MPCFHPMDAWRVPGGGITLSHQVAATFPSFAHPFKVSCSQCHGCRLEHSRQWAVRIMHEAKTSTRSSYLTLTYDDQHLPQGESLEATHFTLFAKAVRNKLVKLHSPETRPKFRYFQCGEYSDDPTARTPFGRPHHHACIFGLDFTDTRKPFKKNKTGDQLYRSEELSELWGQGFVTIGALNFKSAAYVARYIMKKVTGDRAEEHYNGRKPEYITMSRRPGIGATWINKFGSDVYPRDEVIVNGKQARPPKFYDTKLEETDPDLLVELKKARVKSARKFRANNTPERLAIRKKVSLARMRHYKRNQS